MQKILNNRMVQRKGFTLIEVVVVMAIIAVLAVLVVGAINIARNTAKETVHRSNARTLEAGMQAYYASHRTGPPYNLTKGYTFEDLADVLGVQLATTECDDADWAPGGGRAWIMSSGGHYAIIPYMANCPTSPPNELPLSSQIRGVMLPVSTTEFGVE